MKSYKVFMYIAAIVSIISSIIIGIRLNSIFPTLSVIFWPIIYIMNVSSDRKNENC